MDIEEKNQRRSLLKACFWLGASGVYGLICILWPDKTLGLLLQMGKSGKVMVWPCPWITMAAILAGIVICLMAWKNSRATGNKVIHVLSPLSFLPLAFSGVFVRLWLPQPVAANILFLLPLVLLGICIVRAMDVQSCSLTTPKMALVFGVCAAITYALVGWYFTLLAGEHSGDEGHYIIQAQSLYYDHDLDIKNNLGCPPDKMRDHYHISYFAKGGHWYSWHSFGLPLLLAPFVPFGLLARHIILGLLSGIACTGLVLLCRKIRAGTTATFLACGLFCFSSLWGIYSCRCLPEVPGAAFTILLVLAIMAQSERPWGTVFAAALCCSILPWLQARFIPIALTGTGLYGLRGLMMDGERLRNKIVRLGAFVILCLVGYGSFFWINCMFFVGGHSYPVGEMLFSYLPGMWHVMASNRGICATLPVFAWMVGAMVWGIFQDREQRFFHIAVFLFIVAVLLTSMSNVGYYGGAAVMGRYFVVVVPLLVPSAARALEQAGRPARWWFAFLGSISVAQFVILLLNLRAVGKAFADPASVISLVCPLLEGLIKLLAPVDKDITDFYVYLLYSFTTALILLENRKPLLQRFFLSVLIIGSAMAGIREHLWRPALTHQGLNAVYLERVGKKLDTAMILSQKNGNPVSLFSVSDRFFGKVMPSVTSADLGVVLKNNVISQPRIPDNDWERRGYRWATLVTPFRGGYGGRVCKLQGNLSSDTKLYWAVREGNSLLLEEQVKPDADGSVDCLRKFKCHGNGDVYMLVRLEGLDGSLNNVSVKWSPFSDELLKRGDFTLP
ncbi:MAG: hypothetical protein A2283_21245 [Lentisphaerae bacterium RIFOXYA12_FULL_48_11]|nr:MAG: hypothetical protein A2283_21245 [Lentisphaerae bacterium RIFOXYA12_FULL_48_11]